MHRMRLIRECLGVTQAQIAEALHCDQPNIAKYERGQMIPPLKACRLIAYAASLGVKLTYDQIYGSVELPAARRKEEVKA